MSDLTKEDIKEVVASQIADAVITKEDLKEAIKEALAEKFEITFGVDCTSKAEREELRMDMAFLRGLRRSAMQGGERIFWWVIGIAGTGVIALFWPDITKLFK